MEIRRGIEAGLEAEEGTKKDWVEQKEGEKQAKNRYRKGKKESEYIIKKGQETERQKEGERETGKVKVKVSLESMRKKGRLYDRK